MTPSRRRENPRRAHHAHCAAAASLAERWGEGEREREAVWPRRRGASACVAFGGGEGLFFFFFFDTEIGYQAKKKGNEEFVEGTKKIFGFCVKGFYFFGFTRGLCQDSQVFFVGMCHCCSLVSGPNKLKYFNCNKI